MPLANLARPFIVDQELLTDQTMQKVREFFENETTHRPSEKIMSAIEDIADSLSAMVFNQAEPKVHLSSLDPGIGKTTVITQFVDTLLQWSEFEDVGVLLLVGRLDEVRGLVDRMNVPRNNLCVITSDPELNRLGGSDPCHAQILITTQQKLEREMEEKEFSAVEMFHYQGVPRQVRIWDESWLVGQPIAIERYDLYNMMKIFSYLSGSFVSAVEDFLHEAKSVEDNGKILVPDFGDIFGVSLNDVLRYLDEAFSNPDAEYKNQLKTLVTGFWFMFGKRITVRYNGGKDGGAAILTYKQTMPDDLMPILVLDASGRVRETYGLMEKHRQNIKRLKAAKKTYENLTVHVWETPAGKAAFSDTGKSDKLIEGIVSTIHKKPKEQWLIVHHKPSKRVVDVEQKVRSLLSDGIDQSKIHFITWGNHAATNAYADVPNVILAGTLFYRLSDYDALTRTAMGMKDADTVRLSDRKLVEKGEHAHGILQALCRASVRKCEGDSCAPCDAYVIASAVSGIRHGLPDIFPNAKVKKWKPITVELKGKVKLAVDYLDFKFSDPSCDLVKFKDVQAAVKISNNSNFRNDIRNNEDFQQAIADRGYCEWGAKKYYTGFKRHLEWFKDETQS